MNKDVPLDSVSLADSDPGRLEDKKSRVGSHLDLNSLGGVSGGGDGSHAQTGGEASGLGHGVTARAEVVGHDNGLELSVHVDPVHAHGKRRLDVSLERVDHGGDTSLDGAGAARVSGGALGAGEEREELTCGRGERGLMLAQATMGDTLSRPMRQILRQGHSSTYALR